MQNSDDIQLLVVRFDNKIADSAAFTLLSLARCDSFEKMMQAPKSGNEDIDNALARLWTEDDAGRNILRPKGSGYVGAAVTLALLTMFEKIPAGSLPKVEDGVVTPACMAHTTLQSAIAFLENLQKQRSGNLEEGPTRKVES